MKYARIIRIAALIAVIATVAAVGASSGNAQSLSYNCGDIYYTTATTYGSNETIVVDVFNEGRTLASGVLIGGLKWSGPTNVNYYPDHTSTTWHYVDESRGTYDIYVSLGTNGFNCRNPHGRFTIQ